MSIRKFQAAAICAMLLPFITQCQSKATRSDLTGQVPSKATGSEIACKVPYKTANFGYNVGFTEATRFNPLHHPHPYPALRYKMIAANGKTLMRFIPVFRPYSDGGWFEGFSLLPVDPGEENILGTNYFRWYMRHIDDPAPDRYFLHDAGYDHGYSLTLNDGSPEFAFPFSYRSDRKPSHKQGRLIEERNIVHKEPPKVGEIVYIQYPVLDKRTKEKRIMPVAVKTTRIIVAPASDSKSNIDSIGFKLKYDTYSYFEPLKEASLDGKRYAPFNVADAVGFPVYTKDGAIYGWINKGYNSTGGEGYRIVSALGEYMKSEYDVGTSKELKEVYLEKKAPDYWEWFRAGTCTPHLVPRIIHMRLWEEKQKAEWSRAKKSAASSSSDASFIGDICRYSEAEVMAAIEKSIAATKARDTMGDIAGAANLEDRLIPPWLMSAALEESEVTLHCDLDTVKRAYAQGIDQLKEKSCKGAASR